MFRFVKSNLIRMVAADRQFVAKNAPPNPYFPTMMSTRGTANTDAGCAMVKIDRYIPLSPKPFKNAAAVVKVQLQESMLKLKNKTRLMNGDDRSWSLGDRSQTMTYPEFEPAPPD